MFLRLRGLSKIPLNLVTDAEKKKAVRVKGFMINNPIGKVAEWIRDLNRRAARSEVGARIHSRITMVPVCPEFAQ